LLTATATKYSYSKKFKPAVKSATTSRLGYHKSMMLVTSLTTSLHKCDKISELRQCITVSRSLHDNYNRNKLRSLKDEGISMNERLENNTMKETGVIHCTNHEVSDCVSESVLEK